MNLCVDVSMCVRKLLSLYLLSRPPPPPFAACRLFGSRWRTFLSRLGSLTFSLFPLHIIRSRAHSLVRALSGVFFGLLLHAIVLLFYLPLLRRRRRRRSRCVAQDVYVVSLFLFGSVARASANAVTYHQRSTTYQTLWRDTRSRCGIPLADSDAYFVIIWKCTQARSARPTDHTCKLTYIPFSVCECVSTVSHSVHNRIINAISQLSWQYIRFCVAVAVAAGWCCLPGLLLPHLVCAQPRFIRHWIKRTRDVCEYFTFRLFQSTGETSGIKRIYESGCWEIPNGA